MDESKRKQLVCTFWLDGLCLKKENECHYLHVYIQERIPICPHHKKGFCSKGDKCKLRHEGKVFEKKGLCPYYERGFCKLGCFCEYEHRHEKICEDYMYGFCPLGPDCKKTHVKTVISGADSSLAKLANFSNNDDWKDLKFSQQSETAYLICHNCGQIGHKSTYCQEEAIPKEQKQ